MDSESTLEKNIWGTKLWRNKSGKFHRLDGPAIEYTDGTKEWWQNGKRHRLDGPAVITESGYKQWYYRGLLHREDGPAIIFSTGNKQWWVNDVHHKTKEDWFDALSDEAKAKCLFSEDFLNG
jgi:hypothetical protein